jgi:hypothetical protein
MFKKRLITFAVVIIIIGAFIALNKRFGYVIESMTNNYPDKQIILIGDSILNNSLYVPPNKSVYSMLKSHFSTDVQMFAQDGATISDVYGQLDRLNDSHNTDYTYVILSAGGNNIANKLHKRQQGKQTGSNKDARMETHYENLVKSINIKLPNAKLILLNLYYPTSETYASAKPLIEQWNLFLDQFQPSKFFNSTTQKTADVRVHKLLRVDKLLTNDSDFTHKIEPSIIGGEKICNAIISAL